jgi:Tol biopolymer transport system component
MKKILLTIGVTSLLSSCIFSQKYDNTKPELSIAFTDVKNLPSVILFDEQYFIEKKNVFFILSDYMQNYSRLIKYNIDTKKSEKTIYEAQHTEKIREYCNANGFIVFSVLKKDKDYSHDIYLYNMATDEIKKINTYPLNTSDSIMPLSLKTDGIGVVYVEQNFENNTSVVKHYNIAYEKEENICSMPFTDTNTYASIFFTNINSGTIIYDKINNGKMEIIVYDIKSKTEKNIIEPLKGVALNYGGLLNKEKNFLAYYSQTIDGDVIYIHDLNNNKNERLVSFDQYSLAYNDMLYSKDNDILYNVQRNISGNIKDHYYGEVYRLKNYSMEQVFKCFNISIGDKYIAFLKFDDQGIKVIHFELYKYM